MSRVYDALQQCVPEEACKTALPVGKADALFSQQFSDSIWDPGAAPIVAARLSEEEKVPVWSAPCSFASEQFHLLASRLQRLREARPLKSVLLTSSVEGEGKSLLTINLALSLAQTNQQKVLVVDAELRKQGLSRTLKLDDQDGLRDWHETDRPVSEFIYKLGDLNFWILPSGRPRVDPLKLLSSSRLNDAQLFVSAAFDWILFDSPPLLPLADAEIMSRITDATILVIRRDKSPKHALKEALERVAPSKMAGFLLNDFPSIRSYGNMQEMPGKRFDSPNLIMADRSI